MIEKIGNIFEAKDLDAICITTNLELRKNGNGICGAGVAKEARFLIYGLEEMLGAKNKETMNASILCEWKNKKIISFPTKYKWRDNSSLYLIKNSLETLSEIIKKHDLKLVGLPRPGCNNGGLDWKGQVRPLVHDCLNKNVILDKVVIYSLF